MRIEVDPRHLDLLFTIHSSFFTLHYSLFISIVLSCREPALPHWRVLQIHPDAQKQVVVFQKEVGRQRLLARERNGRGGNHGRYKGDQQKKYRKKFFHTEMRKELGTGQFFEGFGLVVVKDFLRQGLLKEVEPGSIPVAV